MTKRIYSEKYRRNLINYWRQYYPEWNIPKGYHVHHITPVCEGGTDDAKNLIALHPDDHVSIHRCRGDKILGNFIVVAGSKITEEGREKLRQHRLGIPLSEDVKNKISKSAKERFKTSKHPSLGRKHTKESIRKMKLAKIGKKASYETRQKMSEARKNRIVSKETALNISKAKKGKKFTEEHKRKLSEAAKRRWNK